MKTIKLKPFGLLVEPENSGDSVSVLDIKELRVLFEREHLIVLRGFTGFETSDEFANYCEGFGDIALWPFGKVLELIQQDNPEDHIFDNSYVPLHWDGMYRKQVPEMQIFQCVQAPGKDNGGKTTFSHTGLLLENMDNNSLSILKKLTATYERKMEFYDSKTVAPIIWNHPETNKSVVRYCEPPKSEDDSFLNHPNFKFEGVTNASQLIEELQNALYAKENYYAHEWQTGDFVLSDNYTLLHGREAFTSGSPRYLRRVQVLGKPALANPHLEYTK